MTSLPESLTERENEKLQPHSLHLHQGSTNKSQSKPESYLPPSSITETPSSSSVTETPSSSSSSSPTICSSSPSSWPISKKYSTLLTATLVCFVVGINSTAILSATDEISAELHIDIESFDNSFFLVTAWNAGAAIVPLLLLPAMEDFGVRPIYLTLYIIFVIFVVVQAVAKNFATMLVARVIAGSCGGALQNVIDGMSADVWANDSKRMASFLTLFIFALLGGVTVGPVIGGAIIRYLYWRWILYIQLIIYGATFPLVLLYLHETRPKDPDQEQNIPIKKRIRSALNETVLRSSKMLCTEFVLSSFTLWSAFAFGTVFLLTQSTPLVYGTLYEWPAWKSGVVQSAILIGEGIGVGLCFVQDRIVYPAFAHRSPFTSRTSDVDVEADTKEVEDKSGPTVKPTSNPDSNLNTTLNSDRSSNPTSESIPKPELKSESKPKEISNPEARLYTSIPASFFGLTAGFFIYAWTSTSSSSSTSTSPTQQQQTKPDHPWPLPTLGLLLIGSGLTPIIQAVTIYITEHYRHNANSAVSAIAFGENIFAAFLPLAAKSMYLSLGFEWASCMLGFFGVGVGVAPLVLCFWGGRMRYRRRGRR